MALIPLTLPPGVWRNGTQYQAKGRYYDSNLVRWYDGQLRPWGGWSLFSSTTLGAPPVRGMIAWADASANIWQLMGTPTKVYVSDIGGNISDITPSGLTAGRADANNLAGYGGGNYGSGTYGNGRSASTVTNPATVWTFDTLEQNPVACNADDGKIYTWDLNNAHIMTQCSGSPSNCRAVFVTQEGFIFALGAGGDPRAVQWPDQASFTSWTPGVGSQANSYELQSAGQIMCGLTTRAGSLIFTTTDVHAATYIGPPFIYSFNQVGAECGIVAVGAYAAAEDFVAWMGINSFWRYDGSVEAIESDVGDYVFTNLNQAQRSKVWALHNATFGEIVWFYPSNAGTEIDSYVLYNYRETTWAIGSLSRTAGVQAGVLANPAMIDPAGNFWAHEQLNFVYSGAAAPYAETGPLEFDQNYGGDTLAGAHPGTVTFDIVQMLPDSKTLGDVQMTFYTRFYPTGPETVWGPYTPANPTSLRVAGREFRLRYTANVAADWRVGNPRLDFRAGGER
jgi:hypothetical protein